MRRRAGLGPTVGLEFINPLCFSGWSFYSSLRGSIVTGDAHYRAVGGAPNAAPEVDRSEEGHVAIADMQIALQYCRGGWFARGGWQAEFWNEAGRLPLEGVGARQSFNQMRPSLFLDGFAFTVGLQY